MKEDAPKAADQEGCWQKEGTEAEETDVFPRDNYFIKTDAACFNVSLTLQITTQMHESLS